MQDEKEIRKFKEPINMYDGTMVNTVSKPKRSQFTASPVIDLSSSCLKGGAPNDKIEFTNCVSSDELQLINRGTDCFVNSVVQLIRSTGYVPFIRAHLPMLIANSAADSYKLSKRLSYIYSENSVGQPKSTAFIRTHVAHMSGKHYLDSKTQQDAEEFMRAIEIVLSEELIESNEFKVSRDLHWGKEEIVRKFVNNTINGTCPSCGRLPSRTEFPFLFLKMNDMPRATDITLSALVQGHFSESTETMDMRCPNCCENQNHKGPCPGVGVCRKRKTVEKTKLTKCPKYLFIQLIRNVGNAPKVNTFVRFETEIEVPDNQIYEVIGTIDHMGISPLHGHYVTHLKNDSGHWRLFDDERSKSCTLMQANNHNNYILLLKKKVITSNRDRNKSLNLPPEKINQKLDYNKNLGIITQNTVSTVNQDSNPYNEIEIQEDMNVEVAEYIPKEPSPKNVKSTPKSSISSENKKNKMQGQMKIQSGEDTKTKKGTTAQEKKKQD